MTYGIPLGIPCIMTKEITKYFYWRDFSPTFQISLGRTISYLGLPATYWQSSEIGSILFVSSYSFGTFAIQVKISYTGWRWQYCIDQKLYFIRVIHHVKVIFGNTIIFGKKIVYTVFKKIS